MIILSLCHPETSCKLFWVCTHAACGRQLFASVSKILIILFSLFFFFTRFHCDWILGWSCGLCHLHVFCPDPADEDRSTTSRVSLKAGITNGACYVAHPGSCSPQGSSDSADTVQAQHYLVLVCSYETLQSVFISSNFSIFILKGCLG